MYRLLSLLSLLLASSLYGSDLVGPSEVEPHKKIEFQIQVPPPGKATVKIEPFTEFVIVGDKLYVWGSPGNYLITTWVVTVDFDAKVFDQEIIQKQLLIKGSKPIPPGPTPPDPKPPEPPTPDPTPVDPSPFADKGFHVLVIYEAEELDPANINGVYKIVYGKEVRDYLDKVCTKINGHPGYRIYDKDTDTSGDYPIWKSAMQRLPTEIPWVMVGNGTTGYEGPMPKTVAEFITLCKKYEPKPTTTLPTGNDPISRMTRSVAKINEDIQKITDNVRLMKSK